MFIIKMKLQSLISQNHSQSHSYVQFKQCDESEQHLSLHPAGQTHSTHPYSHRSRLLRCDWLIISTKQSTGQLRHCMKARFGSKVFRVQVELTNTQTRFSFSSQFVFVVVLPVPASLLNDAVTLICVPISMRFIDLNVLIC